MRILMLTHNMAGIGGNFMRSFSLAKPLAELGHQVTLIASRRQAGSELIVEDHNGLELIQVPDQLPSALRHGGLSPQDVWGRLQHLRQRSYDLVHGFDHRPAVSLPALLGRRWQQIPYVADWADLWGYQGIMPQRGRLQRYTLGVFDHHWERDTRRRADYLTPITTVMVQLATELGVPAERQTVIGVGANTDEIRPLPKAEMRARYGYSQHAQIAVHIGFNPYDVQLLAEAFIQLANANPRFLLLMTGAPQPVFEAIIAGRGLQAQVKHLGIVPYERLQEVLACGDVMLLPYTNRMLNAARFPNRLGDYLAAGRPVVTNPTGDVAELLRRHPVGLLAEEEAPAFATAAQGLLDDPARCEELGRRARALAEGEYSWRTWGRKLEQVYKKVTGL